MMLAQAPAMTEIDLPFIKRYRDRHGKLRFYVRRKGLPSVALPGKPSSPEFMVAYHAALTASPPQVGKHGTGSIGELITEFYKTGAFTNRIKGSSQQTYRVVLGRFAEKHGHRLVRQASQEKIENLLDEIAGEKPAMANLTLSLLRMVFALAVKRKQRHDNPVVGIKRYRIGTHHTWTDAEIAAFEKRWPLGTHERLAFTLLLYTGQRGGDVAKMKRSDIADGLITVSQQKVRKGKENVVEIPLHPALARVLRAGPTHITYLIGKKDGTPMTRGAITRLIRLAVKAADLPPTCKAHGLRKAMQRRLAELGASTKEMQAISGHLTLEESERYSAAADKRTLARSAMNRIKDEGD